jgi:ribosomal protein S18 acetylase RimI-like enzyme
VNGAFRVEGRWPSPITLSRAWGKAIARPWNDEAPDGFLRLLRGRADFLESATERVASISGSGVFSPAMFSSSMRIWKRTGYEEVRRLDVMERPLGAEIERPQLPIEQTTEPPWQRLLEIDRSAFTGFWRMSLDGLKEALSSTSSSATLTASIDDEIVGYVIVGAQWGTAYLQRVAVEKESTGGGVGTALVRAAVEWARHTSAVSMVLNVRSENERASSIYERCGFSNTGRTLRILRYGDTSLLEPS